MKIQILDYGSGNLFSISDSISRISSEAQVRVGSSYKRGTVDALVLPGVGSFTSAQRILSENRQAILDDIKENGMPVLGICLGMQLMFEKSEEGGGEGLELFRGNVKRFVPSPARKVPHMGWNTISFTKKRSALLQGLDDSSWVYYVHSFYPAPEDEDSVRAWTDYEGQRFPATVESGKIFGTQFHPEKSHDAGAKIISNFVKSIAK
jgi:glutamine amidotransferase